MNCIDCKKELSYLDHKKAMESYGVELCSKHKVLMDKLIRQNNTPVEAIKLYYGLKQAGVHPMLEWWDGKKSVDIAFSRVKLNIEIDMEYQMLTHEQAMNDLEETMHSFQNGFTTLRIPKSLIKHYLNETVTNILGIKEGLRANIKAI